MTYNLTQIANVTSPLQFVQNVNSGLMYGWLGTLWLIGIVVVLLSSFIFVTRDVNKSFSATAFIAFGLGLLLRAMSLMSDFTLFVVLLAAGATLAFTWQK